MLLNFTEILDLFNKNHATDWNSCEVLIYSCHRVNILLFFKRNKNSAIISSEVRSIKLNSLWTC